MKTSGNKTQPIPGSLPLLVSMCLHSAGFCLWKLGPEGSDIRSWVPRELTIETHAEEPFAVALCPALTRDFLCVPESSASLGLRLLSESRKQDNISHPNVVSSKHHFQALRHAVNHPQWKWNKNSATCASAVCVVFINVGCSWLTISNE